MPTITIFKKKKKQETMKSKKVIGAYLPLPLIEFITLLAMDKGTSNASLIEEQLNVLRVQKEHEGVDYQYLIDSLVLVAKHEYIETVVQKKMMNSNKFMDCLRGELLKKELSEETIYNIINLVKNATKV